MTILERNSAVWVCVLWWEATGIFSYQQESNNLWTSESLLFPTPLVFLSSPLLTHNTSTHPYFVNSYMDLPTNIWDTLNTHSCSIMFCILLEYEDLTKRWRGFKAFGLLQWKDGKFSSREKEKRSYRDTNRMRKWEEISNDYIRIQKAKRKSEKQWGITSQKDSCCQSHVLAQWRFLIQELGCVEPSVG